MIKVIGVRFRTAGKVYFFDPLQLEIKRGDHVIVETARGIEYGTVVSGVHEVEDDKVIQPLKPVLRIATPRDVEQEAANKIKEREAYKICLEKIRKHELEMKLIDAEYTFDNNKVLFYFTADGRIDFRELVKDLASVFKTRIELRQIGVRDETKIVGGIGICGRPLCCHSYLSDFIPVSIKMAKEQNLSLNPTKISGVCGRLMCCLKNEEETYEELNRRLPGIGDAVTTDDGLKGEVQSVNVLRQIVKVVVDVDDEKEIRDYEVDRLTFKKKHNKKERLDLSKEELKELERLEQEEIQEEAEVQQERRQERRNDRQDRRNDGGQDRQGENRQNGDQERQDRRNERQDRRNDGRQDRHNDHQDRRNDGSQDRQDHRNDRQDRRNDGNQDRQSENRQEGNQDRRNDRQDRRNDGRQDRRNNRQDRHNDNRYERQDRRNENKQEVQQDRQNENRQSDLKADNQQNAQAGTDNQQEQRRDGRNNRYRRNRNRNNNGKNDGRKPENNDNQSEK